MKYYIQSMIDRLNAEDTALLKRIYAPQVVAVPPSDAASSMCVTPEGEIRIYGQTDRKEPDEHGTAVYVSSTDCGLSWKLHLAPEGRFLGAAGYNPGTGRYISFLPSAHRPDVDEEELDGAYAILSDKGFDDVAGRPVRLGSEVTEILKQPYFIESRDRWIILGQYRLPDFSNMFILVFYSDDDGESWRHVRIPSSAPRFEPVPPHKGERWQQFSCEPTIAELSDGRLMLLVRTSQNYHYVYYSSDCGESWTEPEPSIFHGTATMPVLEKLSDGRLVMFWCNNQPLPELDHEKTWPPVGDDIVKGVWEDVFTNRDANDLAISGDDGATWTGFRELFLNPIRNSADFRSTGGIIDLDKSVHQGQMLELPYNKLLVHFGQHPASRRVIILDLDWLYETRRSENFRYGLGGVSTQMYVKSNLGSYHGFSGHCAYNRTDGALLLPDPDGNYEEVLQLCRLDDDRLVYQKQGAVWNFPASKRGEVSLRLRVAGSGVAISLCDHWYNPCDEYARREAHFSFEHSEKREEGWDELGFVYDTEARVCEVRLNGVSRAVLPMRCDAPYGLCYLHLQTLAERRDLCGTLVKSFEKHNI